MSARIAYFRVSTSEQSTESQRAALGIHFDHEFSDVGVSGATLAADRVGLSSLMSFARKGDTVYVSALDRLGRDAIDVQRTVRELLGRGVALHVHGLGVISHGVGELIVAVLSQLAAMEKLRINERTSAGRDVARQFLAATGRTHKGKASLGRPYAADSRSVKAWRLKHSASIADTAKHFRISTSTVSRYCRT